MSDSFQFTYNDFLHISACLTVATEYITNQLHSSDLTVEESSDLNNTLNHIDSTAAKIQSCIDNKNLGNFDYNLSLYNLEAIHVSVEYCINHTEDVINNLVHEKQRNKLRKNLKSLKLILKNVIVLKNSFTPSN